MQISEIYSSKQGEGKLTGQESVFVRTSGCNLRCTFCDTPFTSWEPDGRSMPVAEVVERVSEYNIRHVVITGGEPMLSVEMENLTRQIKSKDLHVTIETAGTIFQGVQCDLMSISPKLSNSVPSVERAGAWAKRHQDTRLNFEVVRRLIDQCDDYQLKFVVEQPSDLTEIEAFCDSLGSIDRSSVLLMPEGVDTETLDGRADWLQDVCERTGFVYCPRMHIYWYGNKRGT